MAMEIVLMGLNHRTAPLGVRERAAILPEDVERATARLREGYGLEEVVLLSTCNRSEVYGVRDEPGKGGAALENFFTEFHGIAAGELNGCLYGQRDREAIRHLYRVAAGLDSQMLGEAEVLGQVREAYRRAAELGSTGPVLNRLFQGAVDAGRRVRAGTTLGARPMSVASAGVKLAERVFGDLGRHGALILGSGETAEQAAEQLRQRGIKHLSVASRSSEHAQALAKRHDAQAIEWDEFPRLLSRPDILVASVSVEQPIVTQAMLGQAMSERDNRSMFLLDLGLPRNIEPEAGELYNLFLYNLDNLNEIVEENRKAREREIPRAEAILDAQISKFEAWRAGRDTSDLIGELRTRLERRRRRLLESHAAGLAHLGPEERERLERLTAELVEELLKEPAAHLGHARTRRERMQQIESLRGLFGLDSEDEE